MLGAVANAGDDHLTGVHPYSQAQIDALARSPETGVSLLWTRTDVRDAARACRLAVEARDVDPGPYNITGARVVLDERTLDLVARYFGDRTEVRDTLPGHTCPLSCTRAETQFGYRPRYVWSVSARHPEAE